MTGYLAGVDVGGTSVKAGLLAPDGTVLHERRLPTPTAEGSEAVVAAVLDAARALVSEGRERLGGDPLGLGVAVLGLVDEEHGVARRSAAVGWRDVPLRDLLRDAVGVPVTVGQDLRAGALAEARLGAGRGVPGFLFVALGTGVGGAVVLDGTPLPGAAGRAAEIGHLVVRAAGDTRCGCGSRGCLETVASATALRRRYQELTGHPLDAARIAEAVRQGEPAARRVWDSTVDALAEALTDCVVLLDPAAVVMGGGVSLAGDLLLDPLRDALARRLPFGSPPPVRAAALGDRAALIGAGLLAGDRLPAGDGPAAAARPGQATDFRSPTPGRDPSCSAAART